MDDKYLDIVIKNIKSDLDSIIHFNSKGDNDKVVEYIDDQIKALYKLKHKFTND